MGSEGRSPLGGALEGEPSLGGEGVGLGALGRASEGSQVLRGQGAGELALSEGLEPASGSEVAGLSIGPGQGAVGHVPDEGLHERVLATLRAERIGVERSAARA